MPIFALIGGIGPWEVAVLLVIILLIFGPRKLPQVAEALGKSIQKFKRASREARDEIEGDLGNDDADTTTRPPNPKPGNDN